MFYEALDKTLCDLKILNHQSKKVLILVEVFKHIFLRILNLKLLNFQIPKNFSVVKQPNHVPRRASRGQHPKASPASWTRLLCFCCAAASKALVSSLQSSSVFLGLGPLDTAVDGTQLLARSCPTAHSAVHLFLINCLISSSSLVSLLDSDSYGHVD